MVFLKSDEEINIMREGGIILSKVHGEVSKQVDAGVSTMYLNEVAEKAIGEYGAVPSFKGYENYKFATCISVNDTVVHGLPSEYMLKEGDVCSIDCGVYYKGYHSDSSYTYPVGKVGRKILKFLSVAKKSLEVGINSVQEKIRSNEIGKKIQDYVESNGYSVIRDLVGHGIGRNLHEEPEFPNFDCGRGMKLKKGMAFALEPMISMGDYRVRDGSDGWSVKMEDGSLSAHYEHTLAITHEKGVQVLTSFDYIDSRYSSFF